MSEDGRFSYDDVPYESNPFAQSHPGNLATLAKLFRMNPKPIEDARVLELGCSSGGNIIPMAHALPNSRFVGVELSARECSQAKHFAGQLGLKNIEFKEMSLSDIDGRLGEFDYIIAHGVYSWVPADVGDQLIRVGRENLAPQGVFYVSYNTYPGWHFRGMIRDMMLYHTKQFKGRDKRAQQARALLHFLVQSTPAAGGDAYGIMLKKEADMLSRLRDYYLIHEHLEEVNRPVYFHDFVEQAARHDLQFLGEAEFSTMLASNFPPETAATLNRISSGELIRTEQYMDFLRNRSFRQSLFCRKELELNRNVNSPQVMDFFIATAAKPASKRINLKSSDPELFRHPAGCTLTVKSPLSKAALRHLIAAWPQSVRFDDLLDAARRQLAPAPDPGTREKDAQALASDILTAYTVNLVELRLHKQEFITRVSERPTACPLARAQAAHGNEVCNRRHQLIALNPLEVKLIQQLDGSRDLAALNAAAKPVEEALRRLAESALLVG